MGCRIVADDYGMSVEINHAISDLVSKNIVSKVSVMANESVEYSFGDIGRYVEIGLHVNLLSYTKDIGIDPNKRISPLKLFYFIFTKRINIDQIIESIGLQHEVLERKGFKISYIDTHQHVHIIPTILKSIINYAKTKGIVSIRCITMEWRYFLFYIYSLIRFGFLTQVPKMVFLYSTGTLAKLKLNKAQINYCKNLILMPLAKGGNYSGLLRKLLIRFEDEEAEIVMHPGFEGKAVKFDDYSTGRYVEYCALLKQIQLP